MFRFRTKEHDPIDWPSLLSLLEDDDRRAAIEMLYPKPSRESFLNGLRRLDPASSGRLLASGRQLHTASQLVNWPTVAIAGMLNSGKTSLVATFLSEAGRARTLRGTNNAQGTHRLVIWLPKAWQNDTELWGLLISRIGDAVGQPPELLSEDPQTAHRQYNNRGGNEHSLAVPLVATDEQLNLIGIGLLDCPDIVSDAEFGLGSPEVRRKLLGRAATLCSAFLVVTAVESSRDGTLGDLLRIAADLMPGVPRMLAVNKVRARQSPDQVLETFRPLARSHGIDTIYAAYDYDVPSSHPFIPGAEANRSAMNDDSEPLPVFFSLSEDPDDNPPASISEDRLLSALPARLDRGQLFERFRLALQAGLQNTLWDEAFARIDRDSHQSQKFAAQAQKCLLESALDFFAHRELGGDVSELRLHQSERIIRQLSESFAVTAPWYARWGVRLNAKVRRIFGGAGDLLRQLTPSAIAQRTAGEIKDKFRSGEYGGLMTPQRLAQSIERHGGSMALQHWSSESGKSDTDAWNEACEAAILRFERDDFTSLDPRRLDDAVRQMWREVPTHKKLAAGLTPLAALLATFGGVLMIPIDFGTTHLIASASIPELFAAAGLTTLSTLWAGEQNTRNVGHQAARQQLTDFLAVLCDTFGVSRVGELPLIEIAGVAERMVEPKIVVREPVGASLPLYRLRDEFRQELQRIVPRSSQTRTL